MDYTIKTSFRRLGYNSIAIVGSCGQDFFLPRNMGGGLAYGLTVIISISVHHYLSLFLGCVHPYIAEVGNVQTFWVNSM